MKNMMTRSAERSEGLELIGAPMSAQQLEYLNSIARQLRATPGELLVALAFGKIESDAGLGEESLGYWLNCLRAFVDERKIPNAEWDDFNKWAPVGRAGLAPSA